MKLTKSKLKEIIGKVISEAKLKDIVPDIIFTAAQYTNKKLDHIARQSWDSSEALTKEIMQSIPIHKWSSFRKDVNKLLKQHAIHEATKINIDALLKNPKIGKLLKKLSIVKIKSREDVVKVINYFARNPHMLSAIKPLFEESINESK
jgi:hypothetical protein